MLARSQRLSVEQFNAVMEKGRVSHSPLFLLRILKVSGKTRISAVVPQKIAKKAVDRNRVRRKIYTAVAPVYSSLKPDLHILIFAKVAAIDATPRVIETDLREAFVKAGLLK